MNKVKKSVLFVLLLCSSAVVFAQTAEERLSGLEEQLQTASEKAKFMPQLHGILRGKYEYEPDLGAYYERSGFHVEAEYLRKFYAHDAFDDCKESEQDKLVAELMIRF